MTKIMQELDAELEKFHNELNRLLKLLARSRIAESQAAKREVAPQHGDTAEARFVLAAQRRVKRHATR
jgi:hypothetical protein